MQESDGNDSLGKLIEDVENAAAEGCCGYFGKRKCESCTGCPARDVDDPCDAIVYGELARRLHAMMPHDKDGREIKAGDVLAEHCREKGTEYHIRGFRVVPITNCNVCITHAPTLRVVQPDSWEKLEEDSTKRVCEYAGAQRSIVDDDRYSCIGCPYDEPGPHTDAGCNKRMRLDLMRRAKALAGVE